MSRICFSVNIAIINNAALTEKKNKVINIITCADFFIALSILSKSPHYRQLGGRVIII